MGKINLFCFILSVFFLAGCENKTTPKGVVAAAAEYAQKDELDDFRSVLIGKALKNFGTVGAMRNFVDKLSRYSKFDLEEKNHVHTAINWSKSIDTYELSATAVLSDKEVLLGTLHVVCYSEKKRERFGKGSTVPRPNTKCFIADILLSGV